MDEHRRLKAILADVIIVVLIAAAVLAYFHGKNRSANYDSAMQQRAEATEDIIRQNRKAGSAILYQLKLELNDRVRGIVCWGDDQMAGNRRGNLPAQLAKTIYQRLFSEAVSEFYAISGLYSASVLYVPMANMGVTNEGLPEILARCGAQQMALGQKLAIHAGTSPVNVVLADPSGATLHFATQPYAKFHRVTIGGVRGSFHTGKADEDKVHVQLTFGRAEAGEAVEAEAGTPVYTEAAEMYADYIPLLYFGEHEEVGAEALAGAMRSVIRRHDGGQNQFAVVCTTAEGSETDAALRTAFGDRYIRIDADVAVMREADYQALADRVFESLDRQGCFDEVKKSVTTARTALHNLGDAQ